MFWFHFTGATASGSSGAGTRYGTAVPPIGFGAVQDGATDSGTATPSGRYGTAEPPIGLWAYNSGAFDDRSSGSPTGQFGTAQPPIGYWALVPGIGGQAVATPTTTGEVGSSGGSSLTFDEWLAKHPWLRELEIRPNWYAYKPEKKKLKAQLVKAAREKKRVERQLSFAKSGADLSRLMTSLNVLQERLGALQEIYREGMATFQTSVAKEAEEEAEFMELMLELL